MMKARIVDTVVEKDGGTTYFEYELIIEQPYNPDIADDLTTRVSHMASLDRKMREPTEAEQDGEQ